MDEKIASMSMAIALGFEDFVCDRAQVIVDFQSQKEDGIRGRIQDGILSECIDDLWNEEGPIFGSSKEMEDFAASKIKHCVDRILDQCESLFTRAKSLRSNKVRSQFALLEEACRQGKRFVLIFWYRTFNS